MASTINHPVRKARNLWTIFNTSLSLTTYVQVVTRSLKIHLSIVSISAFPSLEMSPPFFPMAHLNCSPSQPNMGFPGPPASSNLLLQCPDWKWKCKLLTPVWLGNPMDCSPPGSSVHGILQSGILEWVAMPSSRGSPPTQGSNPSLPHCRQILYRLSHKGSPGVLIMWFHFLKCSFYDGL